MKTNHLLHENSPYLLQHANNPVDWYPWGPEALGKARQEDKPIFLSIGYAACHWCHVMAHESFEDPDTAAIMNQHFVNIKVDREERPDLDSIYMTAVVAMTGQGGWPMSVFLTPQGEPFFGGTYYPPVRRYNMPAFRELLLHIARLWREDRPRLLKSGQEITRHLQDARQPSGSTAQLSPNLLDQAALSLAQAYDHRSGGWGRAPKFPQPMAIEFLLRRASRGDTFALEMALHALRAMASGGMYDLVGGGFARYSTDDHWLVPHFEKMLYDNSQLALVYLHAHLLTGDPDLRQVCEATLDFLLREMKVPFTDNSFGLMSSLDADSEGEEGRYYLWTISELEHILADAGDFQLFSQVFGLTAQGNFEGRTVLQAARPLPELSAEAGIPLDILKERVTAMLLRLRASREQRVRPNQDDKVLAGWNALALEAFVEAARYLGRPDYHQAALCLGRFLTEELLQDGRLMRSWRAGQAHLGGYLEDYACLASSLLALYEIDPVTRWYQTAEFLAQKIYTQFADPDGGFFDTPADHEHLILRPKDIQDNATPSGSALAALALLRLSALNGFPNYRQAAETAVAQVAAELPRHALFFSKWLVALDTLLYPLHQAAVLGEPGDARLQALLQVINARYRPNLVLAVAPYPPPANAPALLLNRPLLDGMPTAYVCQGFVCQRPVNSPEDLEHVLLQ